MKSRTIPSSTPFEVDQFDGRTSVSGNGVVTIENGVASLQRSPKIQIYAGEEGWGSSVEMTGYATTVRWSEAIQVWFQYGYSNDSSQ